MCLSDPVDPATLYPVSFLCPNGTLFSQEVFVCDWWFNVDCGAAAGQYGAVAGAFGGAGSGAGSGAGEAGECPAPSNTYCEGAVSNCWSPGQRDTGQNQTLNMMDVEQQLSKGLYYFALQTVRTTDCVVSMVARTPVWTPPRPRPRPRPPRSRQRPR